MGFKDMGRVVVCLNPITGSLGMLGNEGRSKSQKR